MQLVILFQNTRTGQSYPLLLRAHWWPCSPRLPLLSCYWIASANLESGQRSGLPAVLSDFEVVLGDRLLDLNFWELLLSSWTWSFSSQAQPRIDFLSYGSILQRWGHAKSQVWQEAKKLAVLSVAETIKTLMVGRENWQMVSGGQRSVDLARSEWQKLLFPS